jgi:hypothetical protein
MVRKLNFEKTFGLGLLLWQCNFGIWIASAMKKQKLWLKFGWRGSLGFLLGEILMKI